MCCKKEVVLGNSSIKLTNLRNNSSMTGDFDILQGEGIDTGFKGAKINVSINLRTPTVSREFTSIAKLTFQITKNFPSYKSMPDKPEPVKEEPKKKESEVAKPKETKPEAKQTEPKVKPKMVEFNVDEFKPEELEDPDFIDNLVSLKVLELKIKAVEAEVAKIDGRAPPKIREKLLKMRVKYKVIHL
jgi:hypothetical protein